MNGQRGSGPRLRAGSRSLPKGVAGPCYAIGGVNSGAWPEEYAAIAAADPGDRLGLIQQFYQSHFWNNCTLS